MISAILINAQNEPVQIVKQAANFFIADRAFDCATGSFTVSLKNRRENSRLQDVRVVHIFGDGINRTFKVDKSTMDNTRAFPKLNYDISGNEFLLADRSEGLSEIIWSDVDPLDTCVDLVYRIQNGDPARRYIQLEDTAIKEGSLEVLKTCQMAGGNVWTYIQEQMQSYKFCCDGMTTSFGKSQLRFRVPQDRKDIILSELSRHTHLQYVNTDYTLIRNYVIAGGEGEGIRKKVSVYDSGATGIDRVEEYVDASSLASNEGYVSNAKYYEMLEAEAQKVAKEKELETDYIVPLSLFKKVRTGDTIYTSSFAVNNGRLEPRVISEMKTEVVNGVMSRSITFV